MFSLGSLPPPHSFQEQAWRILCQISLFTRASFEACKRIRSGEFHTLQVYALYRLTTHMEEPGIESRVWLEKRCYFATPQFPKTNCHCTFRFWHMTISNESWDLDSTTQFTFYNIKMLQFLSFYELINSENKVSPSWAKFCTTIEKWRDDGKRLTYKICLAAVKYYDPLQSSTYKNQDMSPSTWTTSTGHQSYTSLPTPTPTLRISFPGHNILTYVQKGWLVGWNIVDCHFNWLPRLCRRSPQNGSFTWMPLTTYPDFLFMLFNTLYNGSQRTVWFESWWSWAISFDLVLIRNFLNNYPCLLMKRKFVFNGLFLLTWLERIHGAFAIKPPCCMDLSFLKRQKDWQKGQALISYFQSYQSTLLKAVSCGLDSMLREVWPQQLGQQSVPQIWNTIHSAFREIPEEVHLEFLNDDVASVCNSVPQDRLLDAVQALIV